MNALIKILDEFFVLREIFFNCNLLLLIRRVHDSVQRLAGEDGDGVTQLAKAV